VRTDVVRANATTSCAGTRDMPKMWLFVFDYERNFKFCGPRATKKGILLPISKTS